MGGDERDSPSWVTVCEGMGGMVKRGRTASKGGDARNDGGSAREEVGEATAVRHAGDVDAFGIDAEISLDLVEDSVGECDLCVR